MVGEPVCLDSRYSTTRCLIRVHDVIEKSSSGQLDHVLILPPYENCRVEGGLRTKGYFKTSLPNIPLITIITVVFNGARTLENTILSVINQPYDNLEYIIIDGASTDGTQEIIKRYESFLDYWCSESDGGIYDAMNKGWSIANSCGRILYLGAGDSVIDLPSMTELVQFGESIIYGIVDLQSGKFESAADWKLRLGNSLHHQALLIPKTLHQSKPFDLQFKIYADYDFNLRLYMMGAKFVRSKAFRSSALPGGVSAWLNVNEMAAVSRKNCGFLWFCLSKIYCEYQRIKLGVKCRHLGE